VFRRRLREEKCLGARAACSEGKNAGLEEARLRGLKALRAVAEKPQVGGQNMWKCLRCVGKLARQAKRVVVLCMRFVEFIMECVH